MSFQNILHDWPVQADQAEVHDGGGGEQDIQRPVDIAPDWAEHPVTQKLEMYSYVKDTKNRRGIMIFSFVSKQLKTVIYFM